MERFRLRVRHQPKRGDLWELKLFPDRPDHLMREADGRELGTCSNPEAIHWLRRVATPFLSCAIEPGPTAAVSFNARSGPCWLQSEDGMRLALAFSAARYLVTAGQRARFQEGLADLPSEVILYWFTLCFYGYRQAAGRAALRTLLTHKEPEPRRTVGPTTRRRGGKGRASDDLFEGRKGEIHEDPAEYTSVTKKGTAPVTEMPREVPRGSSSGVNKTRRVRLGGGEKQP